MIPSRVAITLLLLVAVVLTAAGCLVASINNEKPTTSSLPVTVIGSTPTTAPPPTTPIPSSGYWIKIDPISDKQAGEVFTVNSTTNLSAGSEILVQIYKAEFHPGGSWEEFRGIVGNVKVIPGKNEINTISFLVNSSELYPYPKKYVITEEAIYNDTAGVERSIAIVDARFNITSEKPVKE